jgi:hypothetical protein
MAEANNTRNSGVKRLMAGLFILKNHPAEEFPEDKPLPDIEFYDAHSDCLNALETPSGKAVSWKTKGAPDTGAQAWAFHYYVSALSTLPFFFFLPACHTTSVLLHKFC